MGQKDFARMLEEGLAEERHHDRELSLLEYVGDFIFQFTTYDGEISELFARKALEVCEAVTNGSTFDYIRDPGNYRWFLLMCNMPFFAGRLEWGTSIRGAWWSHGQPPFDSCGLWLNGEQVTDEITFADGEWDEFVAALLLFASGPKEVAV